MLKKKKIKKDHYNISKVRIWSGGQGAEGDACQKKYAQKSIKKGPTCEPIPISTRVRLSRSHPGWW